jgi:hypothetical protein
MTVTTPSTFKDVDNAVSWQRLRTATALLLRVFLPTMLGTLALLVALLSVYRSSWYVDTTAYYYDLLVEQRFASPGPAAIVVFGDSSAMVGVSPRVMESALPGLKVQNAALFALSGSFSARKIIDRYAAFSSRPKLMVYHVSYMNPSFEQDTRWRGTYELIYPILRFGGVSEILGVLSPAALSTAAYRLVTGLPARTSSARDAARNKLAEAEAGWFPNNVPPFGTCPSLPVEAHSTSYLRELKRYAEGRGIKLLVYLAPMPQCDPHFQHYAALFHGAIDNSPARLPDRLFGDSIHLIPYGANLHSEQLAEFIRRSL